jgi:hypothetical protein
MTSSESNAAFRAARYYGSALAQVSRQERIKACRNEIAQLESEAKQERIKRQTSCTECQGNDPFCLCALSSSPTELAGFDKIRFIRSLIHNEEQDEIYAARARQHPVEYSDHIDGFCSYWQNVRHRKFAAVGWRCEGCGTATRLLEAHHLHYDTLGFEELSDLQALCRGCHENAHQDTRVGQLRRWLSSSLQRVPRTLEDN